MNMVSENLRNYVRNKLSIKDEEEINLEDISKIKELNLNRLNYNLEEALFIPEELIYFIELERCSFDGFLITDEIRKNLNKLRKLQTIELNHCRLSGNTMVDIGIRKLNLNYSDFYFINIFKNTSYLEETVLKNITVDAETLSKLENLRKLSIFNCDVKKSDYLNEIKNLKEIKIIGSKLDNKCVVEELKKKVKVEFSEKEFKYIMQRKNV